jgi:hypothetical protein
LAIVTSAALMMLIADMAPQPSWLPFDIEFVTEAHAVAGRQRRTRRRGAAVGYQAGQASASASQSSSQQASSDQQAAQQQQAASEPAPAAAPAPTPAPTPTTQPASGALPMGSVVKTLPAGCVKKDVNGVEYQFDGTNYYRAAFQGNELVYVTSQP